MYLTTRRHAYVRDVFWTLLRNVARDLSRMVPAAQDPGRRLSGSHAFGRQQSLPADMVQASALAGSPSRPLSELSQADGRRMREKPEENEWMVGCWMGLNSLCICFSGAFIASLSYCLALSLPHSPTASLAFFLYMSLSLGHSHSLAPARSLCFPHLFVAISRSTSPSIYRVSHSLSP